MSEFISYATTKGMGAYLVKVPDKGEKIAARTRIKKGYMQDELEWNNKQAARHLAGLESSINKEAELQEITFKASQDINETLAKQKWSNFETIIKLQEKKRQQTEKNIAQLLKLTETGAKVYKQFDAKRKKSADDFALGLWEEHGIGLEKYNAVIGIKDKLWNDEAKQQAELRRLGLDGIQDDILNNLRRTGGYRAIAIAEQDALRWARQRGLFYDENWNTKVHIEGFGEIDLHSAKGSQVDLVLRELDTLARDELGENAPSSKILASSDAYTVLENARATIRRRKREEVIQEAKGQQWNDEIKFIKNEFNQTVNGVQVTGGQAIQNSIYLFAGGKDVTDPNELREGRKITFKALNHALKNGDISSSTLIEAGNDYIEHSSGRVQIKSVFRKEWLMLQPALKDAQTREMAAANLAIAQNNIEDIKMRSEMFNLASTTDTKPETWTRFLNIAKEKQYPQTQTYISSQITRWQTDAADAQLLAIVDQAISENRFMTPTQVNEIGGSIAAQGEANSRMAKASDKMPYKYGHYEPIQELVEDLLEGEIPRRITGNTDYSRSAAQRGLENKGLAYYRAFMQKPGATPQDALVNTEKYIKDQMLTNPLFQKVHDKELGQWVFKIGHIEGQPFKIDDDYSEMTSALVANKGAIHTRLWMDPVALEKKANDLNANIPREILPRATHIESVTKGGIRALEAEMAQIDMINKTRKEEGLELIPQYPNSYVNKVKDTYKLINPKALRLLNKYDYCSVNRAACDSGLNPFYTEPTLNRARTVFAPENDYNSTSAGNSYSEFRIGVVHSTGREVIQMMNNEYFEFAGRFNMRPESIEEGYKLAGIPLDQKFDEETQNRVWDALFKKNGPAMIEQIENPEEKFLMKSLHKSLTSKEGGEGVYGLPHNLNSKAYEELVSRGYFPELVMEESNAVA